MCRSCRQDNKGEHGGDCRREAREEVDGLLLMFWANLAAAPPMLGGRRQDIVGTMQPIRDSYCHVANHFSIWPISACQSRDPLLEATQRLFYGLFYGLFSGDFLSSSSTIPQSTCYASLWPFGIYNKMSTFIPRLGLHQSSSSRRLRL